VQIAGDQRLPQGVRVMIQLTGRPLNRDSLLKRYLKPVAEDLGIRGMGWHSLGTRSARSRGMPNLRRRISASSCGTQICA
jgi:hypothetical protein